MIYYISDLHFGHTNVIFFDKRPFKDRDEMDRVLMVNWNSRVGDDDTVYIVGDLCYRSAHSADWYLKQLKGHKILILGNHDGPILKDPEALALLDGVEKMMDVNDCEKTVTLCHYPIAEWNSYFHGSWHVFGHIHNSKNESYEFMRKKRHALNAGCMINNYMPVTFEELIKNNELFRGAQEVGRDFEGAPGKR